jgi:hypothetical protein
VTTSKGVTFVVPMAWFEEPVSRHGVTPRGDQHINDLPELVDRSVHVPPSPGDFHVGLVHEPAIAYSVPAGAGGLGQQRREPLYPAVDGDVISLDTTLGEEFLDVAIGQPEAQVPADRQDNHVGWEAKVGVGGPRCGGKARAAGSHSGSLAAWTRSPPMQQCRPGKENPLKRRGLGNYERWTEGLLNLSARCRPR